jgi:hypothetical protein
VDRKRFEGFTFLFEFFDTVKSEISIEPKNRMVTFNAKGTSNVQFALVDILEISIPLVMLSTQSNTKLLVRLKIIEDGQTLELWPPAEALKIELPGPDSIPWLV